MVKKRELQRGRGRDSSSSGARSSDETSAEETPPTRSSDIRAVVQALIDTQSKQAKEIKQMLEEHREDLNEIKKQLKKLNGHIVLNRQLERPDCSRGDVSPAPRSEPTEKRSPTFQLRITSKVNKIIETGKSIQTNHGDYIEVDLCDGDKPIEPNHPLASARVMLVVLNGEFNKDNNRYDWSKEDFEKSIRRSHQGNSAVGDGNQRVESIVSDCTFYLTGGSHRQAGATIVNNSGNKSVRLGVMLLSHPEERVLEGLSNHFKVQDPPKKSKKQKQLFVAHGQESNDQIPNTPYSSCPSYAHTIGNGIDPDLGQPLLSYTGNDIFGTYPQHSQQLHMVVEGHHHSGGGAYLPTISDLLESQPSSSLNGVQWSDQITLSVQLRWDRPYVEPIQHWNLLDKLMPLYTRQTKTHRIPKQVKQTHLNRGVLVRPLEADDSDDEPPPKRKFRNKNRLRFVNKVCKNYYTWQRIKADDGGFLKVALYDENNAKVTSGPLSSASVEVVVLHGDFNISGEEYWTSEEFSHSMVCPESEKERPTLGGHCVLVLVDGEASLSDVIFQKTSLYARTGKFKMGIMLANSTDKRVQQGVSEPFWVRNRGAKDWEDITTGHARSYDLGEDFTPTEADLVRKWNFLAYEDKESMKCDHMMVADKPVALDGINSKSFPVTAPTNTISFRRGLQEQHFIIRSGSFADTGPKSCMEDEHIRIDDLYVHLGSQAVYPLPSALYAVFDGHGGPDAAAYMKKHATKLLFAGCDFPRASQVDAAFLESVEKSVCRAFSQADLALRVEVSPSSGTRAVIALVLGRHLLVASAGECGAVLCRKGASVQMSQAHYLGTLSLTRPLGDWDTKLSCDRACKPELKWAELTMEYEFLVLASQGVWGAMSSYSAVSHARRELHDHGDPARCARALVSAAMRRGATDNLTAVVVCFGEEHRSLPAPRKRRKVSTSKKPCLRIKLEKTMDTPPECSSDHYFSSQQNKDIMDTRDD